MERAFRPACVAAIFGWVMVLGLVLDVAAAFAETSRHYVAGRRAVLDQRWHEAVLYLSTAIEAQPVEGRDVIVYGKHVEPYLPHFYLGIAFYKLGALDAAVTAWSESDRQGRRQTVDLDRHPTLGDLVERYGRHEVASRAMHEVDERLVALRARLVESAPPATASALVDQHTAIREAIEEIVTRLAGLRRPGADADSAEDALTLLDALIALEPRVDTLAEAIEAARWKAVVPRLEARLRAGCDPRAIDEWLALLDGPTAIGSQRVPEMVSETVVAGLTRALAEPCGRSQDILLALARRSATGLPGEISAEQLRAAVLTRGDELLVRRDVEVLADGRCDRPVMARLSRWLEHRALAPVDDEGVVRRRLAVAHRACGEQALAAFYDPALEPVSETGQPPPPSAGSWIEATLTIDAGLCDPELADRFDPLIEHPQVQLGSWDPELYRAKAARNCADHSAVASYLADASDEGGEHDGLATWYRREVADRFYDGRYALVFGVGDYDDGRRGWADLPGARQDAEAVREALVDYGFDAVRLVLDPESREVHREMDRFVDRYGNDPDTANLLLVYWAGHGTALRGRYGDRVWSTGFLVPSDAPFPHPTLDPGSDFARRAVSMDQLDRWARTIRSPHAVFMLDSCYSGTAFEVPSSGTGERRLRLARTPTPDAGSWDPFARFREPVRLVITSTSATRQAADDSAFRRAFVDWLERPASADFRRDQVVSGRELCLHLTETTREASIGRQSPSCRCLPEPWDRGDVVFATGSADEIDSAVTRWVRRRFLADLATWQVARERGDRAAFVAYLDHFPDGRFAPMIETILDTTRPESNGF